MLQIQQGRLHAATKANALNILQKEIDLYQSNFGIIATQASILTGFAFSLLSFIFPDNTNMPVRVLFTVTTTASMGFNLIAVVLSTQTALLGPRLALLGTEEDVPRVVLGMHDAHHTALVCNRLGVASFFLSAVFIGLAVRDTVNQVLSTIVICSQLGYCLYLLLGVEGLFMLSRDGEFRRLYNFKTRVDNITEGRRSDYDQQLDSLEKPTRKVSVHKVLRQIRRRRASMATASPAGPGLSPGLGSPGGPIIKSGIVAFRSPDMQDFEPRYLELMQGKLKLRRHRRGRVIRSYILQDQECLFSELRDQPGVFAFECQIGRERMVCQVETVQMVDTWMTAFNKCAEEDENFSGDEYSSSSAGEYADIKSIKVETADM